MTGKRKVPDEAALRIIRAMEGMERARAERDAAISDALKAGASIREVATASGMSTTSIQKIGRDNGWPTAAQKKAWADEQAERDRWTEVVDLYRATGKAPRPDSES